MNEKPLAILLVEDSPSHSVIIRESLCCSSRAVEVTVARSLAEARGRLAEATPDLVIIDLILPDGKGIALLPGKDAEPAYPSIVLTGHGDEEAAVEAMKAGALDYMVKSSEALADMPRIVERSLREWNHIVERRRAEEALRHSEERFRSIVNSTPLGVHMYRLEPDGRLVLTGANPAADAILGRTHRSLIGQTIEEAFPPLTATVVPESYRRVCTQGSPWANEEVNYRDGQTQGAFSVHAFRTGPLMMAAIFADITERRRAEVALKESEERFRSVFENAASGIAIISPEGKPLRANPAFCRLSGYTEEETLHKDILEVTHPDDRERTRRLYAELRAGGKKVADYEKRYLTKDGEVLWGRATVAGVYDADQTLLYFVAMVQNITARKQTEEALRSTHRQLQDIIEFLPDATFVIDQEKKVVAWNRAMEEMSGIVKGEILGRGDYAYAEALYGQGAPILIDQVGASEPAPSDAYDFIEKRGDTLFAERFMPTLYGGKGGHTWLKASPLLSSNGELVGAIESIRDITQRKETENRLREANRELDAFVYTVSHDLRTPLTPIIGYAQHLIEVFKERKDQDTLAVLTEIENQGQKMLALLEDLLSLAKVGHVKTPTSPVDTNEVVQEVIDSLGSLLNESGTSVRTEPLPRLRVPRTLLQQLFENLISNAARYGVRAGHPIEVGGAPKGDGVRLFISDHGPGIPETEREHIFEVFFRGSSGKHLQGTGIGLATVQKIARMHGGRAGVEETPGGGSTFWVEMKGVT